MRVILEISVNSDIEDRLLEHAKTYAERPAKAKAIDKLIPPELQPFMSTALTIDMMYNFQ